MMERSGHVFDIVTLTHDTKQNIENNKDSLMPYEPVIAVDTNELLFKDEQGNIIGQAKFEVDNIEELKVLDAPIGTMVFVKGYYVRGDGAHHYRQKMEASYGGADSIDSIDGNKWKIVHNGVVDVSWFGAKRDINESQSDYFYKAMRNYPSVVFRGVYYVKDLVCFGSGSLNGLSSQYSLLRGTDDANFVFGMKHSTKSVIKNFKIDGLKSDGISKVARGFQINVVHDRSLIENIRINNCVEGLFCNELWSNTLHNLRIGDCTNGIVIDNNFIPDFTLVNGNNNNNSFNGCIIERNDIGLNFKRGFGAQNTFKDFHFENNRLAINADEMSSVVCFDGFTCEINDKIFKGINGKLNASMIIKNAMMMVCGEDWQIEIDTIGVFKIDGIIPYDGSKFVSENINTYKGTIKIGGGYYAEIDVTSAIPQALASRRLELYDIKTQSLNIVTPSNSQGGFINTLSKSIRFDKLNMYRPGSEYLHSGESVIQFYGGRDFIYNNRFYDYKIKHQNPTGSGGTSLAIYGTKRISDGNDIDVELLYIDETKITAYGQTIATPTSIYRKLDTPYYTAKMQQQGIYDDYVRYRDELHEYEKTQNQEEDTMLLPVIQEPEIPESIKKFAEEYGLV